MIKMQHYSFGSPNHSLGTLGRWHPRPSDFANSLRSLFPDLLLPASARFGLIHDDYARLFWNAFHFPCCYLSAIKSQPRFASAGINSILTHSGRTDSRRQGHRFQTSCRKKKNSPLRFGANDPSSGLQSTIYCRQGIGDEHALCSAIFFMK